MTSGTPAGTSGRGRKALWLGYSAIAVTILLINTVNALTVLHDAARAGHVLPAWEAFTWEGTSFFAALAMAWTAWVALPVAGSPGAGPLRFVSVHLAAAAIYSAGHVSGMVALRFAIYRLMGDAYRFEFSASELLYEFRKDLLAYMFCAAAFAVAKHLSKTDHAPIVQPPAQPVSFDIVDSGRVTRVAPSEIIAVRSAGNYVEFLLEEGRRELMRGTLGGISAELGEQGLVRTHRSWLVNKNAVREILPRNSGDYHLVLRDGHEAPLSRRFPQSLQEIRGSGR